CCFDSPLAVCSVHPFQETEAMTKGKGTRKTSREVLKPVGDQKVAKRKATNSKPEKSGAPKMTKKETAKKDPNKPKRPPSALFVFLEDSNKIFKAYIKS
ncbi:HMG1/2-like protein, partial [Trifolium pratense]